MVIERFRHGDAAPVYARFRERGRLAPDGVKYITSWVDSTFQICFQVMEAESRTLIDEWIANWEDLVDFEVFPVVDSAAAQARFST